MKRPGARGGLAIVALRVVLALLPRDYRARFGSEVLDTYRDRREALRPGPFRGLVLWVRTSLDLLRVAVVERLRPTAWEPGQNPPGGGGSGPSRSAGAVRAAQVLSDARFGIRALVRRPTFALTAVLTMALGVGANAALFSVVKNVLLDPLPYPDSDRLVLIERRLTDRGITTAAVSQPDLRDVQAEVTGIEASVGFDADDFTLLGQDGAELVRGAQVTDAILPVFGRSPLMGRDLTAEDNLPGGPRVALISYDFWRDRLGSDPEVLGSSLPLGSGRAEIVGVGPEGFTYPSGVKFWVPFQLDPENCGRGCHIMAALGRLAPGATVELVGRQMAVLSARLEEAYPEDNTFKLLIAERLIDVVVGDVRTALLVLLAAVGLVLLIACANLANLLLVRGAGRRREIGVRSALGAGSGRLTTQVAVETLLLVTGGSVIGLALAWVALPSLVRLAPETLPRMSDVALEAPVVAAAMLAALLISLAFTVVPARRVVRAGIREGLASMSGSTLAGAIGGRKSRAWTRSALLSFEVATSVILVLGAGLLVRSFLGLSAVDPGFEAEGLARFSVSLTDPSYGPEEATRFFDDLERRVARIPGVVAVGGAIGTPVGGSAARTSVRFDDRPEPPPGQIETTLIRVVTPRYFPALGVPTTRGRLFDDGDRRDREPVVLVNEAFVDQYFPGTDPLGRRIHLGLSFGLPEAEFRAIVGVVGNVRARGLSREPEPEAYVPQAQMGASFMEFLVRTAGDDAPSVAALTRAVRSIDPEVPLREFEPLPDAIAAQLGPTRFYGLLLGVFAGVALLLASVGLYGVVAFAVAQRTREFAVRLAIGASASDVIRLVLGQGLRPAMVGLAAGLLVSLAATRVLSSLLFGVTPLDPVAYLGAPVVLIAVCSGAVLVPALRASRVSTVVALKEE